MVGIPSLLGRAALPWAMALYRNGRPRATFNEGTRLSAPTKVGRNAEAEYGEVGAGRWVVIAAYHLTPE